MPTRTQIVGISVTNLVLLVLWLLRENIQEVVDPIKLVKPRDEG